MCPMPCATSAPGGYAHEITCALFCRQYRGGLLRSRILCRASMSSHCCRISPSSADYDRARGSEGAVMFEASHPFAFFDYFRVPYEVSPSPGLARPVRGRPRRWADCVRSRAGREPRPLPVLAAAGHAPGRRSARRARSAVTSSPTSPCSGGWCRRRDPGHARRDRPRLATG